MSVINTAYSAIFVGSGLQLVGATLQLAPGFGIPTVINGISGVANLSGAGGNITVFVDTGNNTTIWISGSGIAQSIDLTATGAALTALNLSTSGALYQQINAAAGVLNLNGLTGLLTAVGSGGVTVTTGAGNQIIISGNDTVVAGLSGAMNAQFGIIPKYTGNFTITGGAGNTAAYRYIWSGVAGAQWTGIMPDASVYSGSSFMVKNISTGATLILNGNIDYGVNYTLAATSAVTVVSDFYSWVVY